jgi:hypothetical protein
MLASKFRNTMGGSSLPFRQGPNSLCNLNSYLYVHTTEAIFVDTFSHLKSAKFPQTISGAYYDIPVHAIKARGAWK